MTTLFNCKTIKNVYLRVDESPYELEITYLDNQSKTWMFRRHVTDLSHKNYHKERITVAYQTIKSALLNNEPFVEIEL
jgi:hypothetical protein